MPLETPSISPSGRWHIEVNAWEARNSLWVESPLIRDSQTGAVVLRFADANWSLDASAWLSDDVVRLALRKYPGNHDPGAVEVTVDGGNAIAALPSGRAVLLSGLEALLEQQLRWT
jgi:hypothetical protein